MDKLMRNITKIILYSFCAILIWIVSNSILYYTPIVYSFNPILLALGTILYMMLIVFIYKKLLNKLLTKKYVPYVLIGIFFVLSIIIGYLLRLNPTWDMGDVYTIAKNHALTGTMGGSKYLVSYPNNIMITVIYTIVFKIVSLFGVKEFITTATFFNAIIITSTVFITYRIAKIMFDNKKALMILIIMVMTTPLYLHVAIYYTDSISMFFSSLILYLFLIINDNKNDKSKQTILLQILLGFILVIAWKVKVTSIFIFIAICVYFILSSISKKQIKEILIVLISFLIFLLLYNFIIEDRINNREDVDNLRMPMEYWILTGLNENGVFKLEYYELFCNYSTYKEKKEAGKKAIIETIKSYSVNDFVRHLTDKLKFAWTDGTYFAPEKLRRDPVNYNILHKFVLSNEKYNSYYKYFPQIMHIGMMVFMICNCIKIAREKAYKSEKLILLIAIYGLMVFLLIWENRSRYILTMLPIYILLEVDGIDMISEIKEVKRIRGVNESEKNISNYTNVL